MATKNADDHLADAARSRARARAAEKAEYEALGRAVVGAYGGDVKGVSARIAAALEALKLGHENEVSVGDENSDSVGHENEVSVGHDSDEEIDAQPSFEAHGGRYA